jgi:endonuclease/exonuclease/phosphatase family metal-dependent hydrolase
VKFSAMTFNMQFGQAWDPDEPLRAPVRLDDTIAFLQDNPHDIYLLQEVERARPGGEQVDPPPNFTRIAAALDSHHSAFAYPRVNYDELPFGIALAIFSRTPLVDFQNIDLPAAPITFEFEGRQCSASPRQLVTARTKIAGRSIQLMNTHLQAFFMIGSTSTDHPEQRDGVDAALRASNEPTLCGGDFNCAPTEHLVEQYRAAGYETAQDSEITWRHQPFITDHLFFNSGLRVTRSEVIPTVCSDHHAVSADFRVDRV